MAKEKNWLINSISQSNIMSDAMLNEVSYGDYALLMVLKDRPIESKKDHKYDMIKKEFK